MANPQKENGYTAIANEIMEALCHIRISGEARQVLDVIFRKTYGYNKRQDGISLSIFCLLTGLRKSAVSKAIKKLLFMNLIITQKGNREWNLYELNKDFTTWKPLPKKETIPKKEMTDTQKGNASLPKKLHTIDNYTKENITKEIVRNEEKVIFNENSTPYQLSNLLFQEIRRNNGKAKVPDLQKWAAEIDKMQRIDGLTDKEIEAVILWCQQDSFWKCNILSASKLREKFQQLWLKGKTEFEAKKDQVLFIS